MICEQDVHSFLSSTFAFEQAEGKVADICTCQLGITSHASQTSKAIRFSYVKVDLEGGLKPITIRHKETTADQMVYSKVELSEDSSSPVLMLFGNQDLTLSPGQTKIFEFSFPLRESGQARATSATFSIRSDAYDLDYVVDFQQIIIPDIWWYQQTSKRRIVRFDPYVINILPKPPKMDVTFVELHDQYYTSEAINLQLEISNGEDEECVGKLHVYVENDHGPLIHLTMRDDAVADSNTAETQSSIALGIVASSKSTFVTVEIPPSEISAAYDLIVNLSYHLASDPETPISKTMSIRLFVVSPFEANYDFAPRFDPAPWPSYFTYTERPEKTDASTSDSLSRAAGIVQRWCLTSLYASFAVTPLYVTKVDVSTLSVTGGVLCRTIPYPESSPSEDDALHMEPNTSEESKFTVITQKLSLDDRRSASLDLALSISWRRSLSSPVNTTLLPVPRLLVASQEPRVLLTCSPHQTRDPSIPALTLSYTIENPSMHFLTFTITMNPSEEFAFSGTKTGTIQLVPLSRRTVRFVVLPSERTRGSWIRPAFVVRDRYFQKVLRVSPGDGCRLDKEGVGVWVPAVEEDE